MQEEAGDSNIYSPSVSLSSRYTEKILLNALNCSAIYHHDDKHVVDSPMDEVLKDADVIHHCMNDLSKEVKEKEKARYESICHEFGLD